MSVRNKNTMKNELLIVEKIEDGIVTVEKSEKESFDIKVSELGCEVKEGDVLKCENGKYSVDKEKTEELRKVSIYLQNTAFGIDASNSDK